MKDYTSWATLNEEGTKELGDIFPEGIVPIISIISIRFTHEKLDAPTEAYILDGKSLTDEELMNLVNKTAKKFNDEQAKAQIQEAILTNQIPLRVCLTSGAGTKNVAMFLPDFGFDDDPEGWEQYPEEEEEYDEDYDGVW